MENKTIKGYVVIFNESTRNGEIFTKDSFDFKLFDNLKSNGEIVDYKVDEKGVLVTKDLIDIINKLQAIVYDLAPVVVGDNAKFQALDAVADELLSKMGEIEQYNNVKRALINMFICGEILKS